MLYFLRDSDNNSIIECSVYEGDLRVIVDIRSYTMGLFDKVDEDLAAGLGYLELGGKAMDWAMMITDLSEIRGWWWEREMDFGDWKSLDEFVGVKFAAAAQKLGLCVVTD